MRIRPTDLHIEIEQGRFRLDVPYECIIEEVAYGFGGIQGLVLHMQFEDKARYLYLYDLVGERCRPYAIEGEDRRRINTRAGGLAELHEVLSERLDSFRSVKKDRGDGLDPYYLMLSLVLSWKRSAKKQAGKTA